MGNAILLVGNAHPTKKPPRESFLSGFLFLLETFTQPVYVYFLKNFFLPTPASPTSPLPNSSMVQGSATASPFIPHLCQECRRNPFIPFLFPPFPAHLGRVTYLLMMSPFFSGIGSLTEGSLKKLLTSIDRARRF